MLWESRVDFLDHMVDKRNEHINFLVVTYSLVRVAPCISTMPLYVGSTWFGAL